jgi:hypothetical protein
MSSMRRSSNYGIAVRLLLVFLTSKVLNAIQVFHRSTESLSSLAKRNRTACLASNTHIIHNLNNHSHHSHNHEPENLDHQKTNRNGYPLDLIGESSDPDHYPCFFETSGELRLKPHNCSDSHFICPIKDEYLPITMTGFEGASTQICHSLQSLEDESSPPVNVIIVGGSVTWGVAAGGCMQGTCSEFKPDGGCTTGTFGECSWTQSTVKYLQHRFTKKERQHLNVVDIAFGGTYSCSLPHTIIQRLQSRNITLTSRDLVLYDYSVNDALCFTYPEQLLRLKRCMEETFEKLVHYSADGSPPTIVLLELYPFKSVNFGAQKPDPESFSKIYWEVAKQFQLPIISYRDLFWHPLFREDLKRYPKLEHILEYKWADPAKVDVHPPWVVHDVYADVISGALELAHQLCSMKNNIVESPLSDPWTRFRSSGTKAPVMVLLNEEAEAKIADAPLLSREEISQLPYAWKFYQDRPRKPGWIIEFPAGTPSSNVTSIDNPLSVLTFNFLDNNTNNYGELATLEVSYMETYHNAGGFRVQVCNVFLESVPHQLKVVETFIMESFTTLDVAVFKVDLNLKSCHDPEKNGLVEVKIFHASINDGYDVDYYRGTQKVKITSVRLTVPKQ